MQKIKVEQSGAAGIIWIIGWLFTIGYAQLSFFKGLLGIIIWPYYLGDLLRAAGLN
jgi:hypothetical protein